MATSLAVPAAALASAHANASSGADTTVLMQMASTGWKPVYGIYIGAGVAVLSMAVWYSDSKYKKSCSNEYKSDEDDMNCLILLNVGMLGVLTAVTSGLVKLHKKFKDAMKDVALLQAAVDHDISGETAQLFVGLIRALGEKKDGDLSRAIAMAPRAVHQKVQRNLASTAAAFENLISSSTRGEDLQRRAEEIAGRVATGSKSAASVAMLQKDATAFMQSAVSSFGGIQDLAQTFVSSIQGTGNDDIGRDQAEAHVQALVRAARPQPSDLSPISTVGYKIGEVLSTAIDVQKM